MRWFKRIALALAILAIVSVAAVLVIVRFLPETDFIKGAVEQRLRDLTGDEITIASLHVGGSFPDVIRIKLEGVAATSKDGQKLLSMNRLVLIPSVTPLLKREISIRSIMIDGLRTSIRRSADGHVQYPFVIAPVSSQSSGKEGRAAGSDSREKGAPEPSDSSQSGLKWSIESVSLADGRIDFIDEQMTEGAPTVVSFGGVSASLQQQQPGSAFGCAARGELGTQEAKAGTVEVKGVVALTGDLSAVERAILTITSESLRPEPFRRYVPLAREVSDTMHLNGTRCTVNWSKGRPCVFSFETHAAGKAKDSGTIKITGEGSAAEDFSRIEKITGTGETEHFPLGSVRSFLPHDVPWDTASGYVSAKVQAQWQPPEDWQVQASSDLAELVPKGIATVFGKQMSVRSHITLDPTKLTLQKMEISEAAVRLGAVTGTVAKPLSGHPALDLTVECAGRPQWLKGLGVRLPDSVKITGSIPVRAQVRGELAKLSVDADGDLTPAAIRLNPILDKPEGEKASVNVKGTIARAKQSSGSKSAQFLQVDLHIPSPHIHVLPQGPPLTAWALHVESGILINGKAVDAKDGVLTLKRGHRKAADDLVIHANVENLTSARPHIKGNLAARLDKDTVSAVMGSSPSKLLLTGETRGKLAFSGNATALNWTLDVPLSSVGLDAEKTFRKPAGVAADLKATGKWSNDVLSLDTARLSLPGIAATGKGILRERNGALGELNFQVKRADVKDLIRFVPSLSGVKASGPMEADVVLKPAKEGVVPHASVRLISVDYQAEKNAWSLKKLHGTLTADGSTLVVPELTGTIQGAIDAPLKMTADLHHIAAVTETNGKVSLAIGKGRIKADRLRKILQPVQLLVGTLLNPQKALEKKTDLLDLDSLTGDFEIKSGTARTSNLRLKGADLGAGAIGSIRLQDLHLDAIAGLHTVLVTSDAIGRIPQVRSVVKKYEGLLKATGLDKELKRVGIDVNDKGDTPQEAPKEVKTPVTVIVKVQGTASSPQVTPVPEDSLQKDTMIQLKTLMN
jgi:hypothetical protein